VNGNRALVISPVPDSELPGESFTARPLICENLRFRSPPPTGASELSFLLVDTRTPYVVDYQGQDGGETAHYMLRWVATTGEKGP